ncbi:uncharacterized protein F5891DRAFT_950408, partial [Suillus fuscotomentosus]
LISAVTSDDIIRKGLYPEPGANVSIKNGGGAKKTEHHWALCKILFDGHEEYGSAFEIVLSNPKEKALRQAWVRKIKNRMQMYVVIWFCDVLILTLLAV